jgi:HK97 family phage prohead protease
MATTPSVDRVGDIIDPLGVEFENPLPFLWMHDHETPVGECRFSKPTKAGIAFEAEFVHPDTVESASLKDRLQLAWDSVKTGLVRAVSVGFRPLEWAFIDGGGIRYDKSEVYELSGVVVPANAEALISGVKSLYGATDIDIVKAVDAEARREQGIPDPEIPEKPQEASRDRQEASCRQARATCPRPGSFRHHQDSPGKEALTWLPTQNRLRLHRRARCEGRSPEGDHGRRCGGG